MDKQRWEESEKRRRAGKRKSEKKEDPGARKVTVEKPPFTVFV